MAQFAPASTALALDAQAGEQLAGLAFGIEERNPGLGLDGRRRRQDVNREDVLLSFAGAEFDCRAQFVFAGGQSGGKIEAQRNAFLLAGRAR